MIMIDGRESAFSLSNCSNLAEVLVKLMEDEGLETRIVTDVVLNDRAFTELYPYQAEDIETSSIERLELRTVSLEEMATDVTGELPKVIAIIDNGARSVSELLRKREISEALEVMQDIVGVTRELINTIQILRGQYSSGISRDIESLGANLGDLLGEINEVLGNEDWLLLADMLEYEFIPACEGWRPVIESVASDIASAKAA